MNQTPLFEELNQQLIQRLKKATEMANKLHDKAIDGTEVIAKEPVPSIYAEFYRKWDRSA